MNSGEGLFNFFDGFLYVLSNTYVILLVGVEKRNVRVVPSFVICFRSVFVIFYLVAVTFRRTLKGPLFFLFTTSMSRSARRCNVRRRDGCYGRCGRGVSGCVVKGVCCT